MTKPLSKPEPWSVRMAASMLQSYPVSKWRWHYDHGLLVKSISEVYAASADPRFEGFDQQWVDHFVDACGEIRTYLVDEYNLDQINPGRLLFPLYRRTGDDRYAAAIKQLVRQLRNQMRTQSGGYWHKRIYPHQMWLDGLYMAEPFHAEYAVTFDEPAVFDDIVSQFVLMEQHSRDPQTGLLYHGWDESKSQKWADPVTGCSPNFWGRAIGWYVMALVDVLDFFPETHPGRETLVEILRRVAAAMLKYQDIDTGLWYQIVNLPGHPGNYLESSVSSMLSYGYAKAVRMNYLAPEYQSAALRAFSGLLANKISVDANGLLALNDVCTVAGLGGTPYRDGSYTYYINEPVAANDFKGVGPFIHAALEMERSAEDRAI